MKEMHVNLTGIGAVTVSLVDDVESLGRLSATLDHAAAVAVDTETHAATTFEDGLWSALRVVAVAVRTLDGSLVSYVVDVRDVEPARLAPVLAKIDVAHAWNANFDDRVLRLAGCPVAKWRDAMITDALLHAGAEGFGGSYHALATVAKRVFGLEMEGKGSTQTSFDGTNDLSAEQVRYAGADAAITLALAEALDERAAREGISEAVELDQRARPFIGAMTEVGIPFDTEGWREHLGSHEVKRAAALAEIAELTVAADPTLEDLMALDAGDEEVKTPGFKVDSDPELRTALNEYIPELVKAFCDGRLLGKTDKLDKTSLKGMIQLADKHADDPAFVKGKALLKAILTYRTHSKILSTYGDGIIKYVADDGRLHPKYKQALVATGRLSSDKPNAQNLSPEMKPFLAPGEGRVFVYADLSQAELRVLAQLAGETRMVETFAAGGDFHAATAGQMFGVDMAELAKSDPENYGLLRKKAKGVSFGIPYGLGAAALATNLTVNSGVEMTPGEAKAMLETYAQTFPNVDAWLRNRDQTVRNLADNPPKVDWDASFRLLELWQDAEHKRRALRRKLGYWPSGEELCQAVYSDEDVRARLGGQSEPSEDDVAAYRAQVAKELEWAFTFDAAVALDPSGVPVSFEGRTASGRRRLYQVPMTSSPSDKFAGVLTAAMLILATTDKEGPAAERDKFAAEHNLDLPRGVRRFQGSGEGQWARQAHRRQERVQCVKAFEGAANKPLKLKFVLHMLDLFGESAKQWLLTQALTEQIRSQSTKFRNQPIQGLVADIVLDAYGDLWETYLVKYPTAKPVCSIHDSIILECDRDDAAALASDLKEALEAAMSRWCPDVPAKADCDVRTSFDDGSVLQLAQAG